MDQKKKLVAEVNNVGITVDLWTNKVNSKSYVGITSHYLDRKCNTLNRIDLGIVPIFDKKTHTNIKSIVMNELDLIYEKETNFIFTTDNGTNVCKAFADYSHIRCAAHNINIILKTAFKNTLSSSEKKIMMTNLTVIEKY